MTIYIFNTENTYKAKITQRIFCERVISVYITKCVAQMKILFFTLSKAMVRRGAWGTCRNDERFNFLIYGSEMRTAMIYFLFAFPLLDMKERDDKDG